MMSVLKRMFPFQVVFLFIFCFFSLNSYAQVSCTASAPSRVEVGQTFEYRVVLNEKPSKIAAANFQNFRVVGGPNQSSSSSISIINGKTTSSNTYTYTYYLQAEKKGTYGIPGTAFIVGGSQITSNSISITVDEASGNAQPARQGQQQAVANAPSLSKDEVYIKAFASKSNPYQGEEVIITYKLYVGSGVNGGFQITNINQPSLNGLWSYQLGDPNSEVPQTYETIDGKRYIVLEVSKNAVFPQKSGEINISPLEMDVTARVIYQAQRSTSVWDQFFGGGQRAQDYQLPIKSNGVKLNVKPLPANGKPDDFSGLAGSFTMKSSLSRNELNANDATNLIITISGSGNIQHIENLKINFPPDFDIAEPKITDNINTKGSNVTGSRSFEYILIPRTQGDFTLSPVTFSYFDTKSKSYKTLQSESFQITVAKGENGDAAVTATSFGNNQKDIKVLDRDIRYIKNSNRPFHQVKATFFASAWYFALLLCPVLLFVIFLVFRRKQIENRRDIAGTKDRKANKVARKRLNKAQKLLHENKPEEFYIEISKALWGYMSDKLRIPLSQLSLDSVETKLREKKLDEEAIREFLDTLQQCEFARFAPGDSTQLMKEMYEKTLSFITKIEKKQ